MSQSIFLTLLVCLPLALSYSNQDELFLYFQHQSDASLHGDPGTMHKLVFTFKNMGEEGKFVAVQTSDHPSFNGNYPEEPFFLGANKIHTIPVKDLFAPSTVDMGSKVSLTLTVSRVMEDGHTMPPGTMMEVSSTVLFTVGSLPEDSSSPTASGGVTGVKCPEGASQTSECNEHRWMGSFQVQDKESGLWTVEARVEGRDSLSFDTEFHYNNFAVGTVDPVEIKVDLSCCVPGVVIKAVDLQGNEVEKRSSQTDTGGAKTVHSMGLATIVISYLLAKWI